MWIAIGLFVACFVAVVVYSEVKKRNRDEEEEPVLPFIEYFTVTPDFICFSSTESCGAQIRYGIGGDFSVENNDCRLILSRGDQSTVLQSGKVSFVGTIPATDFTLGSGVYHLSLVLDSEKIIKTITVFERRGEIVRDVSILVDKGDQTTISDSFTIGGPNSGADYETCYKIVYLTAVQYSDKGTENENVFIYVEDAASGNVRLGDVLSLSDTGIQIADSKILIKSTQTADGVSYIENDVRRWQIAVHMHC